MSYAVADYCLHKADNHWVLGNYPPEYGLSSQGPQKHAMFKVMNPYKFSCVIHWGMPSLLFFNLKL